MFDFKQLHVITSSLYSFQTGVNDSVDSLISIFPEVENEYSGVFMDVNIQWMEGMFLEIGFDYDDDNLTLDLYILDQYEGIKVLFLLMNGSLNEYEIP